MRFQQARLALQGVNNITRRPIERHADRQYITLDHPEGKIGFENVTFAYGKEGKRVLDNLTLNVKAGEKIAILGRIGSGKSTLL